MAAYDSNFVSLALIGIAASGLLLSQTGNAQVPVNEFHRVIAIDSWSPQELKALENGKPVVRAIESRDKQELASIGIVRIKNAPQVSMQMFRASLDQKSSDAMKHGGRFGSPPTIEDLRGLELDDDTVRQLRSCAVGDCDLNLSADSINHFREQINWNAADAKERATQLFREMLLAYVHNYSARGDRALAIYDNRRKPIDLTEVHPALLASSALFRDLAPEFADYLTRFPEAKLDNVESAMHWSVVDFGLKPSITVSHAAAYTQVKDGNEQFFVASKQIYASRYLDASLTFTMLLRVAAVDGVDTYLVFLDRSRSDALEGPIGRFARGIVQRQSAERISSFLDKTHVRLLAAGTPRSEQIASDSRGTSGWLSRLVRRWGMFFLAASVLIVAFFLLFWRRGNRTAAAAFHTQNRLSRGTPRGPA